MADEQVDGVLVILSPQAMTDPTGAAKAVIEAAKRSHKPVLAAWMGGRKVREGIELFNDAGIPTYSSPEKGVRAFMHLVSLRPKPRHAVRDAARSPGGVSAGSGQTAGGVRHDPE